MRPFDRSRHDRRRQRPVDLGRKPGVAWHLPVRVPLVIVRQAHTDLQRLTRDDGIAGRDQFGLDVGFRGTEARQALRRRCRSGEPGSQGEEEES